jgi:peroxiredoxin
MPEESAMIGARAPDFSLSCTSGRSSERHRVSLADYQGRWLVLLFYPRDFSIV